MLDQRSPLAGLTACETLGFTMAEAPDFVLTQVAGSDKDLKKALGKIPAQVGTALEHEGRTIMRIGPKQLWVLGEIASTANLYTTPLSSGRTRIAVSGAKARNVLASCAALDVHSSVFKPGQFVLTGIHHTPVTIHCIGPDAFHIYTLRTFARAVWEWLEDAAKGA